MAISDSSPQADVAYDNGEVFGVYLVMTDSAASSLTVTLLAAGDMTPFAAGDKVSLGENPGMDIEAETSNGDYLCHAMSGEADIEALSVDASSSLAKLTSVRFTFDVTCQAGHATTAGGHVSGCFNYPGT